MTDKFVITKANASNEYTNVTNASKGALKVEQSGFYSSVCTLQY